MKQTIKKVKDNIEKKGFTYECISDMVLGETTLKKLIIMGICMKNNTLCYFRYQYIFIFTYMDMLPFQKDVEFLTNF